MTIEGFNFTDIVNEYADMAYNVAYRLLGSRQDAEDAVQQAYIKVYKNRNEYRKEKNLKNWIYTITLNTARDLYRKKKRLRETMMVENVTSQVADEATDKTQKELVQELLEIISGAQREVVVLHYIENRSVSEIAEILDLSESNVKVILFRARKQILNGYRGEHETL